MNTARMQSGRRGFTLIELMIAVAVLVVVIVATSRIFSVAGRVTSVGQATSSVLQEAAVIEKRLREDIANLSTDGFFAIRQVAVPNDVNVASGGALLNPVLPPDAIIRADQLVFFTSSVEQPQTARINEQGRTRGQGTLSRMYYGHAFQLPNGQPYDFQSINLGFSFDPAEEVLPWQIGTVDMNRTRTETGGGTATDNYSVTSDESIDGTQPEARQWLLARQPAILLDDDRQAAHVNSKTVYLGEVQTERSIFLNNTPVPGEGQSVGFIARQIRNGRMDAAATREDDIRKRVRHFDTDPTNVRTWAEQRAYISTQGIYYPRAERVPPSMHRVDQALSNHVIGSAVSSFIVEWTYAEGVGQVLGENQQVQYAGFIPNCLDASLVPCYSGGYQPEQPWFGLNFPNRGVGFYGWDDSTVPGSGYTEPFQVVANFETAETIWIGSDNVLNNVERYFGPGSPDGPYWPEPDFDDVRVYEAIFGYNRDRPLKYNPTNDQDEPAFDLAYTPWPSAIRVTMVLHDPEGVLENGREFQFVIDLPKRVR